ncbi:hypothetical protein NGRA_0329 [Nosema granulosis]|uniref:Glutaredoxin domain-containing protein n=1 Tax=Nosema granulosis TaxID=83296 RepID=A0A9P6H0K8_9MICR|nr:hypothetical protein NGRA_0329 [Nosema granulosis]
MLFIILLLYVCACTNKCIFPKVLQKKGVIVVGDRDCGHTKNLISFMIKKHIPHDVKYVEDDKELKRYIINQYGGAIPWVYEDGVLRGDGEKYMKQYKQEHQNFTQVETNNDVFAVDKNKAFYGPSNRAIG